jgi:hypothetical protein
MSNIIPFQDMQSMASAIAKSGLFGMKNENEVLALMAVAQAEGLHPATAARDFHIIQGRPALKADAMLARFQNAGGKVEWTIYTDTIVVGVFSHPNGGRVSIEWTIEQATRIGLVKPGSGWQKFPRAMLRSRCISEGIRTVFPGSVTGFYSPEEVQDFEPKTKDMGRAETVVLKPLHEVYKPLPDPSEMAVEEVLVTDNPLCTIPLMVPDSDTPYLHAFDVEDWIYQFATLCEKIGKSKKLDGGARKEKCKALARANEGYIETFTSIQKTVLNQSIANAGEQNG